MREIIYVERDTVTQNGKTTLGETRCYGLLDEDGLFHLLRCCGKRFPLQRAENKQTIHSPTKEKTEAA